MMNCNIYFFLCTDKGYSQYPDNYTSDTIKRIVEQTDRKKNISQVAIYREHKLAYVTYQYRYSASQCFGICCEYNAIVPTNAKYLFDYYDKLIMEMLNKGEFLRYDATGNVSAVIGHISEKPELVNYYKGYISRTFKESSAKFSKLPPENYTSSSNKVGVLALNESKTSIIEALNIYKTVIISRDNPYTDSYASTLKRVNDENVKLKADIVALSRKKKQYKYVVVLVFIILCCAISIILFNVNVNSLNNNIDSLNENIANKESDICLMQDLLTISKDTIRMQRDSISVLNFANITLRNYQASVASYAPIIMYNIEVGTNKGNGNIITFGERLTYSNTYNLYFRFSYWGLTMGGADLTIKIFKEGKAEPIVNSAFTLDVLNKQVENFELTQGYKNSNGKWIDASGSYRVEFWYGNICVGYQTFTIYSR